MIRERYCSYEVAKLLKEKGFPQDYDLFHSMVYNEEDYEDEYEVQRMVTQTKLIKAGTLSSYPAGVPGSKCFCPTHQMACDWLGEIYGIYITIVYGDYPSLNKVFWTPQINSLKEFDLPDDFYKDYDKYGEAVEAALKYVLKNLV